MSKTSAKNGNSQAIFERIQALDNEVAELQSKRATIQEQIAIEWDSDTSTLQHEASIIQSRLDAAPVARGRLAAQYREAFAQEFESVFKAKAQEVKANQDAIEKQRLKVEKAKEAAKQAEDDLQTLEQTTRSMSGRAISFLYERRGYFKNTEALQAMVNLYGSIVEVGWSSSGNAVNRFEEIVRDYEQWDMPSDALISLE